MAKKGRFPRKQIFIHLIYILSSEELFYLCRRNNSYYIKRVIIL
jgi:hypothetical protein